MPHQRGLTGTSSGAAVPSARERCPGHRCAARRPLPRREPHRDGRHVHRVPRRGHPARPPGRGQDHGRALRGRPGVPPALRARGPLGGPHRPPRRRRRPRPGHRPRRGPAVPRHGAGRRRHPARRAARPRRTRRARRVRRHGAGAGRARRGAPARDGAPRRQAGERADLPRRSEVKVADFGLAVAAAQAGASHAGTIMGTVAYLSPEQVATGAADPRSDVYAAGILLYELLTGAPPYTGDTAISVAYRHVNSDVPAPSEVAGDVPPELDALVRRATCRDPRARPADAAAMLAELRLLAGVLEVPRVPVPAPPPKPVEEQRRAPAGGVPGPRPAPRMLERERRLGTPSLPPPGHLRARRRSRRLFAVATALVLVLALGIGLTAWWLGSGRWTAVPSLAGVRQDAAERLLTGGRPGARDAARLRGRRAGGRRDVQRARVDDSAPAGQHRHPRRVPRPPDGARDRPGHRRRRRAGRDPRRPAHPGAVGARSTARRSGRARWCARCRGRAPRCSPAAVSRSW